MPQFLPKNLMVNNHFVILPSGDDDKCLHISLTLKVVTSYISMRAATLSEHKYNNIQKFHLNTEAQIGTQ